MRVESKRLAAGECEGEERLQQQAVCPECGDQHTSARQHSQGRHPDHTRYAATTAACMPAA